MSGWTVVTLHADNDEANAELNEQIEAAYGDAGRDPPTAEGYAARTIQEVRGASRSGVAHKYAKEFPLVDTIIVVNANDTSDSGDGSLFEVTDSGIEKVDEFHGYEGARGNDVTGYFRKEHGVRGYATWEA